MTVPFLHIPRRRATRAGPPGRLARVDPSPQLVSSQVSCRAAPERRPRLKAITRPAWDG